MILETFTALEICVFIGIVGLLALAALFILGYTVWVLVVATQSWLYAHTDRWIDRSRNSIKDLVDSDTE